MNKMKTFLIVGLLLISICSCVCNKESKCEAEPNPVIANIHARTSVRDFLKKPVEKEKIQELLKAAMAAPSGMDRRPWEFVVVDNRAMLDSLAAALPYAKMLTKVDQAIIVCGDSTRSSYWYLDCSMAAQNILLAAKSLDLGAVFTTAYPYDDRMNVIRRLTQLPEQLLPLCVIPIGYPAGVHTPKVKFDETKIHYNGY